jgi:hypothetical protein
MPSTLSSEQRHAVETVALYAGDLGGANHLQGTKPETAGTYSNLIHYGEAAKGGHFAALAQPGIVVSEIRTGLRTLRS